MNICTNVHLNKPSIEQMWVSLNVHLYQALNVDLFKYSLGEIFKYSLQHL